MKVAVFLSTGLVGGDREDELELPDDATDEEIEQEVREWAWNFLDLSWERKA